MVPVLSLLGDSLFTGYHPQATREKLVTLYKDMYILIIIYIFSTTLVAKSKIE